MDQWFEELAAVARSRRLTVAWVGSTIHLEHPTLHWSSFCEVRVFTRAPRKMRENANAQTSVTAPPLANPSAECLQTSVELLLRIIGIVAQVWCEQLDDPYGSGRRFALMELD